MLQDAKATLPPKLPRRASTADRRDAPLPQPLLYGLLPRHQAESNAGIPGIGSIAAAKVLAYLGDVQRFKNAKALAAFVGVTPKLKESGTSVRGRSVIARSGHAAVRHAWLFRPSMVARHHNPLLKTFGDRLAADGLKPKR